MVGVRCWPSLGSLDSPGARKRTLREGTPAQCRPDGDDLDIDYVNWDNSNKLFISLGTGTTISQNQTVKLSYDKTVAGAAALEDAAGNEVASFTDFSVTNNSTVPGRPLTTAPR